MVCMLMGNQQSISLLIVQPDPAELFLYILFSAAAVNDQHCTFSFDNRAVSLGTALQNIELHRLTRQNGTRIDTVAV